MYIQVKADYNGGHELSYRIKGGSSPSTNKPASFVIDNEGRITTFTSLDAEVNSPRGTNQMEKSTFFYPNIHVLILTAWLCGM